ncbi:hypothetical protein ACLVWU_08570 [Bdellovibrio sp. HCB290]|uniref:hypothetical protein n=1 Tax=Bdellovibrio sp. HCB290 TaxID=3394356 RepID=UPI0039B3C94E
MRSLYGPKVFYKSYAAYISKFVGWGKFCISLVVPLLFVFLCFGVSFFFSKSDQAHSSNITFFVNFIGILYALIFLLAIVAKNQHFEVKEDRIIDLFPRRKEYKVMHIEKICLESPYRAGILIKLPDEQLLRGLMWCGSGESDWKDFINTLASVDPTVLNKIFYNHNKWKTPEYSQVSLEESYKKILEVYK